MLLEIFVWDHKLMYVNGVKRSHFFGLLACFFCFFFVLFCFVFDFHLTASVRATGGG